MRRYLERDPSPGEIAKLVHGATPSSQVHVILSANVVTAPLRALAVACAASIRVSVKPSRRDPAFTRALVRRVPDLEITVRDAVDAATLSDGEVHVYGRDETVLAVRSAAPRGVLVRAHGAGLGVAIVTGGAALEEAARRVADDVVVFDQRGCLSPRVVLVVGDASRGAAFADALALELAAWEPVAARGVLDRDEARDAARYVETMRFAGSVARGDTYAVGLAPEGMPLVVPPPGRHVHVATVGELCEVLGVLTPIERLVVAVGTDDEAALRAVLRPDARVRWSPLGQMQKPPFDGPVDLR